MSPIWVNSFLGMVKLSRTTLTFFSLAGDSLVVLAGAAAVFLTEVGVLAERGETAGLVVLVERVVLGARDGAAEVFFLAVPVDGFDFVVMRNGI